MKKKNWLRLPEKSEQEWFSDYLVSHMVLTAILNDKKKRVPKFILGDSLVVRDGPKGTGIIDYEVKY